MLIRASQCLAQERDSLNVVLASYWEPDPAGARAVEVSEGFAFIANGDFRVLDVRDP